MLEEQGFVRFPAVVPASEARILLDVVWEDYAQRHDVVYGDPSSWLTKNCKEVRLYGKPPRSLRASPGHELLVTKLHEAADAMFGPGVYRSTGKTSLFVNCPARDSGWSMPSGWHTDVDFLPLEPRPSFLYAFVFLDLLEPHGGATMLLTGSMRLAKVLAQPVPQGGKKFMDALAKENDHFETLFYGASGGSGWQEKSDECERLFKTAGVASNGVCMQVVELTGSPGDLVVWDPRSLHSASSNANSVPRSVIRFRLENMELNKNQSKLELVGEHRKCDVAERCFDLQRGQLGEGQRSVIKQAWDSFDSSGTLVREPREVGQILKTLGVQLDNAEFRSIIKKRADGLPGNTIEFSEYLKVVTAKILRGEEGGGEEEG